MKKLFVWLAGVSICAAQAVSIGPFATETWVEDKIKEAESVTNGLASVSYVDDLVDGITDGLATVEQLTAVSNAIPSVDGLATVDQVTAVSNLIPDTASFATRDWVGQEITNAVNDLLDGDGYIMTNLVSGSSLVDKSITGDKLANNAVNGAIIANLSVSTGKLTNKAVTTAKLADNAVTKDKIDGSVTNWLATTNWVIDIVSSATPGNYSEVSNRAMQAVISENDPTIVLSNRTLFVRNDSIEIPSGGGGISSEQDPIFKSWADDNTNGLATVYDMGDETYYLSSGSFEINMSALTNVLANGAVYDVSFTDPQTGYTTSGIVLPNAGITNVPVSGRKFSYEAGYGLGVVELTVPDGGDGYKFYPASASYTHEGSLEGIFLAAAMFDSQSYYAPTGIWSGTLYPAAYARMTKDEFGRINLNNNLEDGPFNTLSFSLTEPKVNYITITNEGSEVFGDYGAPTHLKLVYGDGFQANYSYTLPTNYVDGAWVLARTNDIPVAVDRSLAGMTDIPMFWYYDSITNRNTGNTFDLSKMLQGDKTNSFDNIWFNVGNGKNRFSFEQNGYFWVDGFGYGGTCLVHNYHSAQPEYLFFETNGVLKAGTVATVEDLAGFATKAYVDDRQWDWSTQITNKPINVSAFNNDAGYVTASHTHSNLVNVNTEIVANANGTGSIVRQTYINEVRRTNIDFTDDFDAYWQGASLSDPLVHIYKDVAANQIVYVERDETIRHDLPLSFRQATPEEEARHISWIQVGYSVDRMMDCWFYAGGGRGLMSPNAGVSFPVTSGELTSASSGTGYTFDHGTGSVFGGYQREVEVPAGKVSETIATTEDIEEATSGFITSETDPVWTKFKQDANINLHTNDGTLSPYISTTIGLNVSDVGTGSAVPGSLAVGESYVSGLMSLGAGYGIISNAVFSVGLGKYYRVTNSASFVWTGAGYYEGFSYSYGSHGDGTFSIDPIGGAEGFWIGSTNLATYLQNAGGGGGEHTHSNLVNGSTQVLANTNGTASILVTTRRNVQKSAIKVVSNVYGASTCEIEFTSPAYTFDELVAGVTGLIPVKYFIGNPATGGSAWDSGTADIELQGGGAYRFKNCNPDSGTEEAFVSDRTAVWFDGQRTEVDFMGLRSSGSQSITVEGPTTFTTQQTTVTVVDVSSKTIATDDDTKLEPVYGDWVLDPSTYNGHTLSISNTVSEGQAYAYVIAGGQIIGGWPVTDDTYIVFPGSGRGGSPGWSGYDDLIACRSKSYRLGKQGGQNSDKLLAPATLSASSIAPIWSNMHSYTNGDFVIYNTHLYECTNATYGAWAPAAWKKTSIAEMMGNLRSILDEINGEAL